jgi:hypothetical protein
MDREDDGGLPMDLERMLDRCRREQWSVSDLDWSTPPRRMPPAEEEAICQLFTDMAGIERLAAKLFEEQERRADDPTLRAIFRTFVKDELRHAQAAAMLADHYDVRRLRPYRPHASLDAFFPPFVDAIKLLPDDVANTYIMAGELILDIALLRSLDDFVADAMSAQAMRLINRDESRHIAIDYRMAEYYASPAYRARAAKTRVRGFVGRVRAAQTFVALLWAAQPFFRDVFFEPMRFLDPSGRRLREAMKRLQVLGQKETGEKLPFTRFMLGVQDLYERSRRGVVLPLFSNLLARVGGVEPELMARLYTEVDVRRARAMSYAELADEALSQKLA